MFSRALHGQNTVISPNFLVWTCGKAPFPHIFGQFARNHAETAPSQTFYVRKLGQVTVLYTVLNTKITYKKIKKLA